MYCVLDCCGDSLGQVSNTTFTVYLGCNEHHTPPDMSGAYGISDSLGLDFAVLLILFFILSLFMIKLCRFLQSKPGVDKMILYAPAVYMMPSTVFLLLSVLYKLASTSNKNKAFIFFTLLSAHHLIPLYTHSSESHVMVALCRHPRIVKNLYFNH